MMLTKVTDWGCIDQDHVLTCPDQFVQLGGLDQLIISLFGLFFKRSLLFFRHRLTRAKGMTSTKRMRRQEAMLPRVFA